MNKQELLNELTLQFYKLGNVAQVTLSDIDAAIRIEEGVTWYMAGVYEHADDRLIRKNVPFYVELEGEVGEAAFYAEKLPVDTLVLPETTTFKELVEAEILIKIAAGVIVKGVVESVNEAQEFAFVTAYRLVTGEIVITKFFGYNDSASELQFTPIKGV